MEIRIDDGLLTFNDQSVRYDKYHLSPRELAEVLREWIPRLRDVEAHRYAILLPFSIDYEYIEAFEVEGHGEQISLRAVKLDGIGYDHGVDSLLDAITRVRPIVERRAKEFLLCDRKELIEAVEQAIVRYS